MSDSGYTVNKVTDASLRQSFMYAQLAVRGLDTNMIGTSLTVELSKAFDAYFAAHDAEVAAKAWDEGAKHVYAEGGKCSFARDGDPCPYNPYRPSTPEQEEERNEGL